MKVFLALVLSLGMAAAGVVDHTNCGKLKIHNYINVQFCKENLTMPQLNFTQL